MTILVIIEHDNENILPATFNAITAALKLEKPIEALVVGKDVQQISEAASKIKFISKIIVADSAEYAHNLAENMAPLIKQIAENYSHIFTPSTTFGKNIMPRTAALLDVMQISDIIEVISSDTFKPVSYTHLTLPTT